VSGDSNDDSSTMRARTGRDTLQSLERQQSFMELYLPLRDRLARFARTLERTEEDVEDLVGETMLAAYERFETVRTPQAFLSFLFTIAVRAHRRRAWRARLFGRLDNGDDHAAAPSALAPDVYADVRLLRRALMRLPAKQRETVTLFEISGLSLEEVREIQGGSLSGVKSRLTRGRHRLAELLGDMESKRVITQTSVKESQ
jgi:RNA polymerase sigma factor (sigma-70 family)